MVVIEGLEERALRAWIAGRLTSMLSRLHVRVTTARVQFTDENGGKGGVALRCSVTVHVARSPELHADTLAADARTAFEQASAALERQIARAKNRVREVRRHPKKYYLAKRLLEPEATPDGTPAAPTARRRRRRSA